MVADGTGFTAPTLPADFGGPTGSVGPDQTTSSIATRTATAVAAAAADAGMTAPAGGAGGWVPGFGAKATITVTIDWNDLNAATADATGQLVYGDNLSAAAIRRLACDATIVPLVLGSNSEPLDVGREQRLVTRAMRRALNARDRGCVVCGAPPIQCHAHHLKSWIDGGVTAVWNLVLLCARHHADLHAGHWTITIVDGVVHVARPTWAEPRRPRIRHRHQPKPPNWIRAGGDVAGSTDGAGGHGGQESAPFDPWGDELSAPGQNPRHQLLADQAGLKEAARFAVWGDSPADTPNQSPGVRRRSESRPLPDREGQSASIAEPRAAAGPRRWTPARRAGPADTA